MDADVAAVRNVLRAQSADRDRSFTYPAAERLLSSAVQTNTIMVNR